MNKLKRILPIVLKWISLLLFSVVIIAGFFVILKHYDPHLKNSDWLIHFTAITWYVYLLSKFYIELTKAKFEMEKNHGFRVLDFVLWEGNKCRIVFIDESLQQASIEPIDSGFNIYKTSLRNLTKIN